MDLVKFLFGVLSLAAIVAGQDDQRVQFPETAARSPQEFLSKVYDDSKIFTFNEKRLVISIEINT